MLTGWSISAVALVYVLGLFAVAYYVDRQARKGRNLIDHPGHLLALASRLLHFVDLLWQRRPRGRLRKWLVLRKTVRIARANRITSTRTSWARGTANRRWWAGRSQSSP
jgi:hypothetical protein